MSPWDWNELIRRRSMVRFYRGQAVSAYMKAVRLRRPADAMYWLAILIHGKAGLDYVRRRVFCSAAEDNCDVWVMEHCEGLLTRKDERLKPLQYGSYVSCLGTKWYELPDGQAYTKARAAAGLARHPNAQPTTEGLFERYLKAVRKHDVDDAYWCIAEGRHREGFPMRRFYGTAADAGEAAPDEVTRRLAAIVKRQLGWLGVSREKNHLWQLLWHVARGPLQSALREPNEGEFEWLVAVVNARLEAPLEAVPTWALDGIHTSGYDPRFAGSWEGCLNMVAMFQRDGWLDPNRPGILVHEHEKRRRQGPPGREGHSPDSMRASTCDMP